jgi:peroxiredoxin
MPVLNNRFTRYISYGVILTLSMIWIYTSRLSADAANASGKVAPHTGFLAPEISLVDLDGNEIDLSKLRGRPVVLNFWATWCPPCRAEMPAMQRAYEDYKGNGVIILAVNSMDQDSLPAVKQFVDEYGLTFPVLLDNPGIAARDYQVTSLPTTYFIGRNGTIREVVIGGPMAEALLRTRIDRLLEEAP